MSALDYLTCGVTFPQSHLIPEDPVARPGSCPARPLVCAAGWAFCRAAGLFSAHSFHYRSHVCFVLSMVLLHLAYLAVSLGSGKCLAFSSHCHFHIERFSRSPVKDWVCLCSGFGVNPVWKPQRLRLGSKSHLAF